MRKFILKSSLFVIPFFTLFILNLVLYKKGEGDLTRVGFLYSNPSPKSKVISQFDYNIKYKNVSELDLNSTSNFDVMIIGDSFSNQGFYGYVNLLANQDIDVLNFDKFLTQNNPIQKLIELANGDFFSKIKTDYVILQTVERMIFNRCEKLSLTKSNSLLSLNIRIVKHIPQKSVERNMKFFSNTTLKMPITNIQYLYMNNPSNSLTYKVKTKTKDLFSGETDNLLFTKHDITFKKKYKDNNFKIQECNSKINELNQILKEKDIELILLICPDKYDLYYPFIKDKTELMEPFFFKHFDNLPKDYQYVKSMEILSEELIKTKDVYFYDDTHWSPIGANVIAKEIQKLIKDKPIKN